MSAAITGQRFLSTGEPAWHRIGQSYTGPKTALEACDESGASDVTISLYKDAGWMRPDGSLFTEGKGDRAAIVRAPLPEDPQEVILGYATTGYGILQNRDLCEAVDRAGLSKRWPVETIGVLAQGATIFLCLDMGEEDLAGDAHKKYLLFTDTRNGTACAVIQPTFTRVVCQNTLNIALGERRTDRISLTHDEHIAANFGFTLDVFERVESQTSAVRAALLDLQQIPVGAADVKKLIAATFPLRSKHGLQRQYERIDDPSRFEPAQLERVQLLAKNWETDREHVKTMRQTLEARYDILCDVSPQLAGTGLGFYNAVCEVADHTRNGKPSLVSIYGYRAMEKAQAYHALVKLGSGSDLPDPELADASAC